MKIPDININLGNGNLNRTAATDDGVAGMVLTGKAVAGKLELNRHYQLASVRDLVSLGITADNNPLAHKDITAFYTKAGEGAELHIVIVSEASTFTQMTAVAADSPLRKLIDGSQGRIRLVGLNRLPPAEYTATIEQGIDSDVLTAIASAQSVAESYAGQMRLFRGLISGAGFDDTAENLFKPREASYNRWEVVLASDDPTGKTAAIGQLLGRAAAIEPQISIARVRDGAIATKGYFTNGKTVAEMSAKLDALHDAGYVIYRTFPTRNGVYLNDDPMAAPLSDDYSNLNLGRIIDKAILISYEVFLSEIMDNVTVDTDGKIDAGQAVYYRTVIENAIAQQMGDQISNFEAYVDTNQDVLGTSRLTISEKVTPQGTLRQIDIDLAFSNPYKS